MKLDPFQDNKALSYPLFRTISVKVTHPFKDHWCKSNPLHKTITRRCLPSKMVSNTSLSNLNTSHICCSHCNSVHPTTSSTKPRTRAPITKMIGHHPLTSSNYRHHCQSTNTEIDATRKPSKMRRCLSQETTTSNTTSQQFSHFTTVNPISNMDTCLITDTTIEGHTSLHTTLQVITSQGSKLLHVKVNPWSSMQFYPPILLLQSLPQVLHQIRSPKEDIPQTYMDDMVSP